MHDGLPVHRFGVGASIGLRELYGEGDPVAAANFSRMRIVPARHPPLRAFPSAVSVPLAQSARSRNIPVVFTYHTPAATCCRGTMLEWGTRICDGEMRVDRCARCMLHGKGLPKAASWLMGAMPRVIGGAAGAAGFKGDVWTALRSTELVGIRHAAARQMLFEESDHIFAVCEWVRAVLLANGVPANKITLSRQGSPYPQRGTGSAAGHSVRELSSPIRFAFLGRFDPVKGLNVIIEALAMLPDVI